jgi:demethylmenaquinone methyltransferase/2-methoxy-6-polyprenyl-1,4-benzoquinol methylase
MRDSLRHLMADQQHYYSQRAAEYDVTSYGVAIGERVDVRSVVDAVMPVGDVLEIACGTGVWTEHLARHATTVTALDGAEEMLTLARERVPDQRVRWVHADVFEWEPDDRVDVVFFAFWISHVPPELFGTFWTTVAAALRPGGRAVFVDELPDRRSPEGDLADTEDGPVARRVLRDGSRHRVVKVFFDPASLQERLHALGWTAEVHRTVNAWFVGQAAPPVGAARA